MHFLLLTLEYPPQRGGIAQYYSQMVRHWPQPHQITVLDNQSKRLVDESFLGWRRSLGVLWSAIKKNKIDYVLVGQILPLGTAAWFVSFALKVKYAVFLHGMDLSFARRSFRKRWLAKRILARADKIICANTYLVELLQKEWGGDLAAKAVVVNPGVERVVPHSPGHLKQLSSKHRLNGSFVLFSLGRLVRRKGFDRTIEALPLLFPYIPALRYFVAGQGPDEEWLRQWVKKVVEQNPQHKDQLLSAVVFLGGVSEEEKWAWLDLCDIFIMPARDIGGDFEGFGIVYLEANLAGKPVIAGRAGGVKDAVQDGLTGLMVDPDSPQEIARAVLKLYRRPHERAVMGRLGKERAEEKFAWPQQAVKIIKATAK
ncbi:glycosyltransferase family 1 protein [Candidatus Parcubacteria bacterium]|nr:MAG: glycosyltransferase family 1 protein [Candidatus Parcubacteria bacterium]